MTYERGKLGIEPKKESVGENTLESSAFETANEKQLELHVQKRMRDIDDKATETMNDTRKEYNDVSDNSGLSKQVVGVLDRATSTSPKLEKMFHEVFELSTTTKQAIIKEGNIPSQENPSFN